MAEPLRLLAVGAAAACLALASTGCGDEEPPVRVAVLTECIGPLEVFKESILAAAQLPFIQRGARPRAEGPAAGLEGASFGGHPVEMLVGCINIANLSGLIIEVRRLIETSGADVIIGPVGETGGIITRRLAARYPHVTFLLGASGAQAATLSDPQPNVFRFVADGAQSTAGLAAHAYTDLGWRRAALVMDPFEPHSWEQAAGFVAEFCALGGTVVSRDPLLVQLAPDRALGARLSREVDGTMLITTASSPTHFLRTYDRGSATLPRRLLLAGFWFAQPGGLSPGGPPPRGVDLSGVVLGGDLPLDSERPQWRRQQRAYVRAFPQLPSGLAHGPVQFAPYMAAEALARALERVDGDLGRDGRRLRAALSKVAFDGPAGPVRLDRNRQAVVSVHLRRIEGRGERARTVPFRVVEGVDQSFGGAFDGGTPAPSFESPKCRRGPVPAWAAA
jgi:branched-chain amino acid transport system substrate-binding protein